MKNTKSLHSIKAVVSQIVGANIEDINLMNVPEKIFDKFDFSINAAMVYCRPMSLKPLELAEIIASQLEEKNLVESIEVVKPGFINIKIKPQARSEIVASFLDKIDVSLDQYRGRKINIEYVSANPTGPMHIGHVRSAVYGSALSNLHKRLGFDVTQEYYINDNGGQIETLSQSVFCRYKEAALGKSITIPEGCYPGDYLIPVGEKLFKKYSNELLECDESHALTIIKDFAVKEMLALIKKDLSRLRVKHDVFTSEKEISESGKTEESLQLLKDKGFVQMGFIEKPKSKESKHEGEEELVEQEIFLSKQFGDDMDRPVRKKDGSYAYFAPDIAYHYDKYKRGFEEMVLVLGVDHKGYVKRLKAAVSALTDSKTNLKVLLTELVNLMKDGKKVKSSKRKGNFLLLSDLLDEIDVDAIRFMMLTKKNDTFLNFDLDVAKSSTKDNPVFYVQYCHSRCASLLRKFEDTFGQKFVSSSEISDLSILENHYFRKIINHLNHYSHCLYQSLATGEINKIVYYMIDLASLFHSCWHSQENKVRFVTDDIEETKDRMTIVLAVKNVIADALSILSVDPSESM